MPKKKLSTGATIALIIGGCVLILALLHLAVAYYFLRAKFQIQSVEYSEEPPIAAPADAPVDPVASSEGPAR